MGVITKNNCIREIFKFQFRQLDTFIHQDHQKNSSAKHVDRFLSTRLNLDDYRFLFNVVKNCMYAMCTPFDEESLDLIKEIGFDIIKVASCSAKGLAFIRKSS